MRSSVFVLAIASVATATNLYVSSYIGTITTLKLTSSSDGSYEIEKTSVNNGSAPSPSWLTLDRENKVLYCLDENLSGGNGSVSSYSTSPSGDLEQIDRQSTITGPVSSIIYNGGKAQAVAH
jgi:6-phosphogluconolactonase (cycloisomerase 2 family)